MKKIKAAAAAVAVAWSMVSAPAAQALPANCQSQYWLLGGLLGRGTQRVICDGPIKPDGSWMRSRAFYASAMMVTNCGSYTCWTRALPELNADNTEEIYPVTPETVLPDEPGHIG